MSLFETYPRTPGLDVWGVVYEGLVYNTFQTLCMLGTETTAKSSWLRDTPPLVVSEQPVFTCPSPSTRRGEALSSLRLPRLERARGAGASAPSESHRRAQQKAVVWCDLFARATHVVACVSRHGNKCAGNGVRPVHPTGRSRPPQAPVATSSPTAAARPHHRSSTSRASTLRRRPRVKNAATNTGTPSVSPQWCRRKWRRETQTPPPPIAQHRRRGE